MIKLKAKLLPNYLTVLRLVFVPFIFALILNEQYIGAAVLYVIASITDILDGKIARKYNLITDWGSLVDPLADKITQISTISALIIKKIIPFWILVIIAIKEIVMIITATILYKKEIVTVKSKWYGKLATTLFFIAIVFSLLTKAVPQFTTMTIYIYYVAIFATLFAGLMYAKDFVLKSIRKEDQKEDLKEELKEGQNENIITLKK